MDGHENRLIDVLLYDEHELMVHERMYWKHIQSYNDIFFDILPNMKRYV